MQLPRGLDLRTGGLQHLDALDIRTKVHNQNLGILSRADDASVITLGGKYPAVMPLREIEQLGTGFHVPHLNIGIVATGNKSAGNAVDMQRADKVAMGFHLTDTLASVGIPDANDAVVACRSDIAAVFGKLAAGKTLGMAQELADLLAGFDVPELNAEVAGAGDNGVAAHLDGVDGAGVAAELLEQGARGAVPDADGHVLGAGDDVLVVENEIEDGGGVVTKLTDGLVARSDVVDDAGGVG